MRSPWCIILLSAQVFASKGKVREAPERAPKTHSHARAAAAPGAQKRSSATGLGHRSCLTADQPAFSNLPTQAESPSCVFMTGISHDAVTYLPGVLCILKRLRDVGSKHPLVLALPAEELNQTETSLRAVGALGSIRLAVWNHFPNSSNLLRVKRWTGTNILDKCDLESNQPRPTVPPLLVESQFDGSHTAGSMSSAPLLSGSFGLIRTFSSSGISTRCVMPLEATLVCALLQR